MSSKSKSVKSKRLLETGKDILVENVIPDKDGQGFDEIQEDNNKVHTLEEVEHGALIGRITNIMKNTHERLQLALIIADILQQTDGSTELISGEELTTIRNLCRKYLHEMDLSEHANGDQISTIDKDLINALDMLHKNEKIPKFLATNMKCFPETFNKFLEAFSNLISSTENRINTNAKTEVRKEKMLHKIFHENERLNHKIAGIKAQIRERKVSMQWKIAEKQALIQKYKKDLATKKWNNNILVKKEVSGANDRMSLIYAKSEGTQQELREEADEAKMTYEQLLQDNIRVDKALREKKTQILTQLSAWIKKYDTDIGERTEEVERLDAELAEKTMEFDDFMKEYDAQEEEYNAIIALRDAEEKRKQEEKMIMFMMNRAAKIIQTKWREFMQKKKKKGKQRGKKAKK